MKKTLQCWVSIFLCVFILSSVVVYANASEVNPRFSYISTVKATLSINENSGKASCYGVVSALDNNTVKLTCTLQQNANGVWKTIHTWESTGNRMTTIDKYYYVYPGYAYRVCVTGYVLGPTGNVLEHNTQYNLVTYSIG